MRHAKEAKLNYSLLEKGERKRHEIERKDHRAGFLLWVSRPLDGVWMVLKSKGHVLYRGVARSYS